VNMGGERNPRPQAACYWPGGVLSLQMTLVMSRLLQPLWGLIVLAHSPGFAVHSKQQEASCRYYCQLASKSIFDVEKCTPPSHE
jgi:hypothetical protein